MTAPSASGLLEERNLGWAKGLFSPYDLATRFEKNWHGARRFGVVQGGAYRPIDRCSEHGQNSMSGTVESVDPAGIDKVAGLAVHLWRRSTRRGSERAVGDSRAEGSCNQDSGYGHSVPPTSSQGTAQAWFDRSGLEPPQTAASSSSQSRPVHFGARNVVWASNGLVRAFQWIA